MIKIKKQVVIIILVLMLGLIGTGCEETEKKNQEDYSKPSEEIEESDETATGEENPYVLKLNDIADQIADSNDESVQRILNQAYAAHGALVENIYFADHKGKLLLSPALRLPEDYDARQRPWYKNALDEELYKPAAYHDQTVEKNIQTIAKALYKDDELIGVLGMDYEVEESQVIENSDQVNETLGTSEKKSLLSSKEREKLKRYAEELSAVVETEDDLTALKKYFDGEVEEGINGVETIYLANSDEVFIISPYEQLPDNYNPSLRPWYEFAIKDSLYISETFHDVDSNHRMVIISTKVELEDDTTGVLGIDFIIDL